MNAKLGEVYYMYPDAASKPNQIDVFRCIRPANEKDSTVFFENIETKAIGHIDDSNIVKSDLICIVPRYTLKIVYIGESKLNDNLVTRGYIVAMAPISNPDRALFEPFYCADIIDSSVTSNFKKGDVVSEIKLYPWETFESLKSILYKTTIRRDILKAHASNVPKRFPKPNIIPEPKVPIKAIELIDLILAAIDKDLGVNIVTDTRINKVTNGLYKKFENKLVRFYKELELFITNTITAAYAVKLDVTINVDNVKPDNCMFIRCGERGEVYVVSYTTSVYGQYKQNYNTGDEETVDTIDFLYASIGRKNPKQSKEADPTFTYGGI